MRRLLVFVQLLASIALILVILAIGSRRALVSVFNIGTVVLWLNFLSHFDLLKSLQLRIRLPIYSLQWNS